MINRDPVIEAESYMRRLVKLPHLVDIDGEFIYEGDDYYEIDGVIYAPSTLQSYKKSFFAD